MGLFSSSSKQSQSVTDTSAGASVAGDAAGPVSSLSVNAGSNSGTFNFSDMGAIGRSFDFADSTADQSFGFAKEALDKATGAFNTTRDALIDNNKSSLAAVTAAKEPADEQTRQQQTYLLFGVLILVGTIFYFQAKAKS